MVPQIDRHEGVDHQQFQHENVGDRGPHSAHIVGHPAAGFLQYLLIVAESRLGHPSIGLHRNLVGANLFDALLGRKALCSQGQLTLALQPGQVQLMALVGLVLEELQQLWQAGNQQAAEGRDQG